MADKRIDELILRDDVDTDCYFVVDDGIQTYRVSASQLFSFVRTQMQAYRTFTGNTTIVATDVMILLNGAFTQALPAISSLPDGWTVVFYNIHASSTVTLDGNSSETIDTALTIDLLPGESVKLRRTSTKWLIVP